MAPLPTRPVNGRHPTSGPNRTASTRPVRPEGWGFEAPRAERPMPTPERRSNVNPEKIHTAGHELNHAIVAMHMGIPISEVTAEPGDGYLGRTVFACSGSAEVMKIILAAGSVSTHDGTAKGFGSDMFQAELLTAIHGGSTVERARAIAYSIINQYDTAVRERAAVILAESGTVGGAGCRAILVQAQNEIAQERAVEKQSLFKQLWAPEESMQREYIDTEERTIVSTNGDESRVEIFGGDINRELTFCNHCGHYDGHSETCIMAHEKSSDEPQPDAIKKPTIPEGEAPASEEFDPVV